ADERQGEGPPAAAGGVAGLPARRLPGLHQLGAVRAQPGRAACQPEPARERGGTAQGAGLAPGRGLLWPLGGAAVGVLLLDQGEAGGGGGGRARVQAATRGGRGGRWVGGGGYGGRVGRSGLGGGVCG